MPISPSFVEHAVDLLAALGPVQARRMFGGVGLYCDGVMFGLLDGDELFLKTDGETRPWFLEAGCRMWIYPGMYETSYYRPPDDAHEDAEAMLPWARLALDAAIRAQAARAAKARAPRGAGAKARPARRAKRAKPGKAAKGTAKAAKTKRPAASKRTRASVGARRTKRTAAHTRRPRTRPAKRGRARPARPPR
ncbi:TfoX/Sxy family protein [Anaeromyxobacter dehalogenans]|uniref:TfoX-like protein n=1 Tax=Anaeromyxobacter dehalogenans (strain 2CP-C) TaxID=290397 RepID=Q2IMI5_ANADE|nr:TfoX/Sxy family protein [Anaeromyxobacter dehalogenans]ABC80017.1 TfoX-like protein [Anaeromyxobacter dehalogenans 2CP-C]